MKLKVSQIIGLAVIACVLVFVIVANCILLEPTMRQNLTGLLCPPIVDTDALDQQRAEGQALADQIVQDGSVLVKNNGVLPLDSFADADVNVFGHASIDWVYGGSGSGQVVPENNNAAENIDFLTGLDEYGIIYNTELTDMYRRFAPARGDTGSIGTFYDAFYRLTEPDIGNTAYYTPTLLQNAQAFSDTAFVVIGRHAGETEDPTRVQYKNGAGNAAIANDNSRHYLEISTEEEALLRYVGATYEKVIVIVNSTNTMELDFVDTIPGIDACLVVGAPGTRGARAIPSLLYGDMSPSGHFADTYAYDMASNINFKRTSAAGIGHYTNASELYPTNEASNCGVATRTAPAFIDYIEGIYVGYKWYETADAEGIWNGYSRTILDADDNNVTVNGYESVVQYPFGFGMSYTTFDWEVIGLSLADGSALTQDSQISVDVRVTNTGDVAGKDVVQVYLTPEYKDGSIEKSHVTLVGFAKTAELDPGKNQTLTVTLDPYDFASYDVDDKDQNGFKGYELESGKYEIKLMTDSHNVKTVDFVRGNGVTAGQTGVPGVITYNVATTINLEKDKYTKAVVSNKFTGEDAKDGVSLDGTDSNQNIGYISRASFPDPASVENIADREMTDEVKKFNEYTTALANEWDNATEDIWGRGVNTEAVTWGANTAANQLTYDGKDYSSALVNNKAKVYNDGAVTELGYLLGSDYDNPLWEVVLNQVTINEAANLIRSASFGNQALDSIGKPRLSDYDGPNQVRSFNAGTQRGTGFPMSVMLAQTFDQTKAYTFGINYGKEMSVLQVDGVYGFGCNMHRSAWGGRNYEYLSEDAYLTAAILTQQVRGLKNTGKYGYLKHLALYETEHERDSMYTWCNEQALREIYLKPFQKAVQEGGSVGIMSSYNRIGNVWTGGSEALITGIVREEWGFHGAIVTDYVDGWSQGFMAIEDAIRAGGNYLLGGKRSSLDTNFASSSNRMQNRMKEICHQATYMFLSALYTNREYNAQDDVDQIVTGSVINSWEWWVYVLADLDVLLICGCVFYAYMLFRKNLGFGKKKEKAEAAAGDRPPAEGSDGSSEEGK